MAGINAKAGEHDHCKLMGKCYVNCHSQDARSVTPVHLMSGLASQEHCPHKDGYMFPVCSRTKQDKQF